MVGAGTGKAPFFIPSDIHFLTSKWYRCKLQCGTHLPSPGSLSCVPCPESLNWIKDTWKVTKIEAIYSESAPPGGGNELVSREDAPNT